MKIETILDLLMLLDRRSAIDAATEISICSGWVQTVRGKEAAPRTVAKGVRIILKLATLASDVANGGFFNEDGSIPW